jgi:Na+/citrate or Na+/malate symporter
MVEHELEFYIPANVLNSGIIRIRFLSGILRGGLHLRNIIEGLICGSILGFTIWVLLTALNLVLITKLFVIIVFAVIPAIVMMIGIYGGKSVVYILSVMYKNKQEDKADYRIKLPGLEK